MVVCVDDDVWLLDSIIDGLRLAGLECTAFYRPEDALAYFTSGNRPDLLVVDYRMPTMTGVELATKVRQIIPSIPLVFHSGSFASEMGAFDNSLFKLKGCLTTDLAADIRYLLAHQTLA